jgi:hypothetical protein
MPAFPGVDVPRDFWWAMPPPAPLAAMPYPRDNFDWAQAASLGFRTVLCLTEAEPGYDPSPLGCVTVHLQVSHRRRLSERSRP